MEDTTPKKKTRKTGTREDVWEGRSEKTSGGLRKDDLVFNEKSGKLCTKKEVERGKKLAALMQQQRAEKTPQLVEVPPEEFLETFQ